MKSHGIRASTAKVSSRLRVVPPEIPHQPTIVTKRRVPSDIIHSKSSKPVLRSPTEPKKADKMRVKYKNSLHFYFNIFAILSMFI